MSETIQEPASAQGGPSEPDAGKAKPDAGTAKPDAGTAKKAQWLLMMLPKIDATVFANAIAGRAVSREATADKIIKMGETAANAAKAPGESLAHGVSAHGPGTDQMPRLVTGRRADEVADEPVADRPATTVALNGGPDGAIAMPAWTKVGDDPSNVSSRFGSATQMLHAVEEAFAQAAQVQSKISAETRELDRKAMEFPEVKAAAEALGKARTQADKARAEAKTASVTLDKAIKAAEAEKTKAEGSDAALAAAAKVEPARLELEAKAATYRKESDAIETAIADLRTAKATALPGHRSGLTDDRMKLVVEPGGTIGESFAVGDDQKALKKGEPLTQDQMQERYASVAQTGAMTTATMIMDPAHVVDEFGQKHRAGMQLQTAFPSAGDKPQRELSQADYDAMRTQEKADDALAPTREALKTAQQQSKETAEQRDGAKTKIEGLRSSRKKMETQRGNYDPEFKDAEDKATFFTDMDKVIPGDDNDPEAAAIAKTANEKREANKADFMALLTPDDMAELSTDGHSIAPGKEHDALTRAVKALDAKLDSSLVDLRTTEALETSLATKAADLQKTIAAKEKEVKTSEALTAKTAGETADAVDAVDLKAAKDTETEAGEELAALRKARADAKAALDGAPGDLTKDEREKLEQAVAKTGGSEAISTERSAARRLKTAREAIHEQLTAQQKAGEAKVETLTEAKVAANDAVTKANAALVRSPAPVGAEPQEADFAHLGNKQKPEFNKAKALRTRTKTANDKAQADLVTATTKLTQADTKLTEATDALAKLKTDVAALAKLIEETSAEEAAARKTKTKTTT